MLVRFKIVKLSIICLILSVVTGQNNLQVEKLFVQKYLMNHLGKMNASPLVWQDVKKGHLRFKAIHFAEQLLDSLDLGYPPINIALKNFNKLTDMRWDGYESGEYQFIIDDSKNLKHRHNYFSSSSD